MEPGYRRKIIFDAATILHARGSTGRLYVNCMYELQPLHEGGNTVVFSDRADIRGYSAEVQDYLDDDDNGNWESKGGYLQYYNSLDDIPDTVTMRLYHVGSYIRSGDFELLHLLPTVNILFQDVPVE